MVHCAASLLVPFALLRTFAAYMHRGMSSHVFLEHNAASVVAACAHLRKILLACRPICVFVHAAPETVRFVLCLCTHRPRNRSFRIVFLYKPLQRVERVKNL